MSTAALAPITRSLELRCSAEHAFHVFTERTGSWWPLDTHAVAHYEFPGRTPVDCRIEPRVGGRFYEVMDDGTECDWGRVAAWEPAVRLAIDWNPSTTARPYTRIDLRFTATGADTCRLDLEHSGWERLEAGADARASYEGGWAGLLPLFAAAAEAPA